MSLKYSYVVICQIYKIVILALTGTFPKCPLPRTAQHRKSCKLNWNLCCILKYTNLKTKWESNPSWNTKAKQFAFSGKLPSMHLQSTFFCIALFSMKSYKSNTTAYLLSSGTCLYSVSEFEIWVSQIISGWNFGTKLFLLFSKSNVSTSCENLRKK